MIEVYVLKRTDLKEKDPSEVPIPSGHFRASGHIIILRDEDPDNTDDESDVVDAYTTSSSALETRLFGNAFVHSCELYKERVFQLAQAASVELEGLDDKETAIELEPLGA